MRPIAGPISSKRSATLVSKARTSASPSLASLIRIIHCRVTQRTTEEVLLVGEEFLVESSHPRTRFDPWKGTILVSSHCLVGLLLGVLACAVGPKPSATPSAGVSNTQAVASRWMLSHRCAQDDAGTWRFEFDGCAYSCAKEGFQAVGTDGGQCSVPLPTPDVAASWENEERCMRGWEGDWRMGNCMHTCRAGNVSTSAPDSGFCDGLGYGRSPVLP